MENGYLEKIEDMEFGRTSKLSFNDYIDAFNNQDEFQNLLTLEKSYINELIESIQTVSPRLYESIKNKSNLDIKQKKSLIKYLIRATSRATPFDTLSGVYKRGMKAGTRYLYNVDEEWCNKLVELIQSDLEILNSLNLIHNPNLYRDDITYTFIPYSYNGDGKRYHKSELVNIIYENTHKPIMFKDLCLILRDVCDEQISLQMIISYLMDLVKDKFLITNLNFKKNNNTTIKNIYMVLKDISEAKIFYNKIDSIITLLNELNKNDININKSDIIINLQESMSSLVEHEHYFKIDSIISEGNCRYCTTDTEKNIDQLVNCLFNLEKFLPQKNTSKVIRHYILEKYGRNVMIPITEILLNPDLISKIKEPEINNKNTFINYINSEFEKVLDNADLLECDIDLNEIDFFNKIYEKFNKDIKVRGKAENKSIELCFNNFLINSEVSELVYLSSSIGSNYAGRMIGRFIEILPSQSKTEYGNYINVLENFHYNDNTILCELSTNADRKDILNIMPNEVFTKYECSLGIESNRENKITVDDIFLYVDSKSEVIMYSKNIHKKMIFRVSHMYNSHLANDLYQILVNLSEGLSSINILSYLKNVYFSKKTNQKVKFKNIVLFNPRLKLNLKSISNIYGKKLLACNDLKEFIIPKIKERFKSNYVYIEEKDNKLLLNLENADHIYILYDELKNKDNIILLKVEDEIDEFMLNNKRSTLKINEFIKAYDKKECKNIAEKIEKIVEFNSGWRTIPMDNVVYLKLYVQQNSQNYILNRMISPFVNKLIQENIIDNFHFIRYKDEDHHIRLRFININNPEKLMEKLIFFQKKLYSELLVKRIAIDTYEREVHRYGNCYMVDTFEKFFYKDSQMVLGILELLKVKGKYNKDILAIITILNLINILGLTEKDKDILFEDVDTKDKQNLYRKYKDTMFRFIGLKGNEIDNEFYKLLMEREDSIKEYKNKIQQYDLDNKNIANSCIHMFCNRLYGIDFKKENEVRALAKLLNKSLRYVSKDSKILYL